MMGKGLSSMGEKPEIMMSNIDSYDYIKIQILHF